MFCEKCGTQLQDSDRFCPKCGSPVPSDAITSGNNMSASQSGQAQTGSGGTSGISSSDSSVAARGTTGFDQTKKLAEAGVENAKKLTEAGIEGAKKLTEAGIEGAKKLTEKGMEIARSGGDGNSSKKKLIIPIAIAAAAVAVVLVTVAASFDRLSNFVHKTFSSPEKYYQYVEKKNVDELSSVVGDIYKLYLLDSKDTFDTTYNAGFSLELGKSGQDLLELAGIAGVDLSWLESLALNGGFTVKDDRIGVNLSTALNKEDLVSLAMAIDADAQEVFLQIPEMTNTYIGLDAREYMSSSQIDEFLDVWEDAKETFDDVFSTLPSQSKLEKLVKKYMRIALGCVEDVEKKSKDLRVEGVEASCTLLTVTLDADTLEDVLDAILEEAEDDKDLEDLFIDIGDAFGEDGGDIYDDLIDSLEYISGYTRYLGSSEIVMSVYVDGKGKVVGREMEIDGVTVALLMPQKGSKFGYELSMSDRRNSITLTGDGKRSGDKIDGEFRLQYAGVTILEIETDNLDLKTMKRGQLNGKLEVGLGSGIRTVFGSVSGLSILQDIKIGITAKTSADSYNYGISLANDGDDLGTVAVSAERKRASSVKIPSDRNVVFVEDERDFEDWVDTVDWDKVVTRMEKAGLPRSVTKTVDDIGEAIEDDGLDGVMRLLQNLRWGGLGGFRNSPSWATSEPWGGSLDMTGGWMTETGGNDQGNDSSGDTGLVW